MGEARSVGDQKSVKAALPMFVAGLLETPAKKRQTIKAVGDCEKPAPTVKHVTKKAPSKNTGLRPSLSLQGPATRGPTA